MEIRDSRGRFTKGNPGGGRPKKQLTTEELLQALSPEAITRLHDLIYSDNENIALRASVAILDLALKYDAEFADEGYSQGAGSISDTLQFLAGLGR